MHVRNILLPIPLTNIDSSTLTTSYQAINSSGLPNPCNILRIINSSTTDVTISYDGINDHDYLVGGHEFTLNATTNGLPPELTATIQEGTVVYVKGTAGTGNVYLAGYYQPKV
jgi:hypothetical protein